MLPFGVHNFGPYSHAYVYNLELVSHSIFNVRVAVQDHKWLDM